MTDLRPVHELLADLGRKIEEEEINVRERIDRLSEYDDPDVEDRIREEWGQFRQRIAPMERQRDYVLKQLATIEAMKIPGPIVVTNDHVFLDK